MTILFMHLRWCLKFLPLCLRGRCCYTYVESGKFCEEARASYLRTDRTSVMYLLTFDLYLYITSSSHIHQFVIFDAILTLTIDTTFKLIVYTRQLTTKRLKLAWRERLKIALYYFYSGVNLVTMAIATVAVRHAKLLCRLLDEIEWRVLTFAIMRTATAAESSSTLQ
jgi:hypothetical protein